jgi:hypothetical protein
VKGAWPNKIGANTNVARAELNSDRFRILPLVGLGGLCLFRCLKRFNPNPPEAMRIRGSATRIPSTTTTREVKDCISPDAATTNAGYLHARGSLGDNIDAI